MYYRKMMQQWLLVLLVAVWSCRADMEFKHQDKSKWVDPGDMLNYDMGTQTMRSSEQEQTVKYHEESVVSNTPHVHKSKQETTLPKRSIPKPSFNDVLPRAVRSSGPSASSHIDCSKCVNENTNKCDTPASVNEVVFLRQYVTKLMNRYFNEPVVEPGGSQYKAIIKLTPEQWQVLDRFHRSGTTGGSLQDAHAALNQMFKSVDKVYETSEFAGPWEFTIMGLPLNTFLLIITGLACSVIATIQVGRLRMSLTRIMFKLSGLLFLISIPWNWYRLYTAALAKKYAQVMKEMPRECRPEGTTMWQNVWQALSSTFSFSGDKCAEYHEAMLVNPIWEVPPTEALAVTCIKFILEPASHIGDAISKFLKALLKDLPTVLWPVVLVALLVGILLVITMYFRYSVCLFGLPILSAPKQEKLPAIDQQTLKQIENQQEQIEKLTIEMEKMKPRYDVAAITSGSAPVTLQPLTCLPQVQPAIMPSSTTGTQSHNTILEPVARQAPRSQDLVQTDQAGGCVTPNLSKSAPDSRPIVIHNVAPHAIQPASVTNSTPVTSTKQVLKQSVEDIHSLSTKQSTDDQHNPITGHANQTASVTQIVPAEATNGVMLNGNHDETADIDTHAKFRNFGQENTNKHQRLSDNGDHQTPVENIHVKQEMFHTEQTVSNGEPETLCQKDH